MGRAYSSVMTEARTETETGLARRQARLGLLDGARGIALLVVIVSHGWLLWDFSWIDTHGIRPVFRSGNAAVTVFLVASGYLIYRVLAAQGLERMRPGIVLGRRLLRVVPSLWAMLAVLFVFTSIDSTDTTSSRSNTASILHVVTYTWNWLLQTDVVLARWDLGHLWYLSVEMQAFLVMVLVIYVMRRRPVGILFVLAALWLLLTWWRVHVSALEPELVVLVRTTARMDALVVGVALGAAVQLLGRLRLEARLLGAVAVTSLVTLVPLFWYCSVDQRFLGWGVTLLELDLAVLFGASALGASGRVVGVLGVVDNRPLRFLGRQSLLVYIWHYPIFAAVARHGDEWSWGLRVVVAAAVLVTVSLLSHRFVERRVTELLGRPFWGRLRDRPGRSPQTDEEPASHVERHGQVGHLS